MEWASKDTLPIGYTKRVSISKELLIALTKSQNWLARLLLIKKQDVLINS